MIESYSMMTWIQFCGIFACLAGIACMFYKMHHDHKSLAKQLETIARQNGTVENAHEKILDKQSDFSARQSLGFLDLSNSLGAVRKSVEEEPFSRNQK